MKHIEIRAGFYRDSVSLMQVSQSAMSPGVSVLVAMATPLNLELAQTMGFVIDSTTPNDLLIAIDAVDAIAVNETLERIAFELAEQERKSRLFNMTSKTTNVLTIGNSSESNFALISVPGEYAFIEAVDALEHGKNVMIFSDNVSVGDECFLKDLAQQKSLLVMGPDCGTAIIAGVGLGFANVVLPGPVGIIAASGTGAQHLCTLLDHAGVGISHCIGLGGRDLSSEVAGRSAFTALALLEDDPNTEVIVLVSKPAAPEVSAALIAYASKMKTPVIFGILGKNGQDITSTAREVLRRLDRPEHTWDYIVDNPQPRLDHGRSLRGLFAGGTLCDEAMIIAAHSTGESIHSNIALEVEWQINPFSTSLGHTFIDFGDDAMTIGRAHPMIDSALRVERFRKEIADPQTGAILLDIVLGLGATSNPAADLSAVIQASTAKEIPVFVSLIGSRNDPQNFQTQWNLLLSAGAQVFLSNAEATRAAIRSLTRSDANVVEEV